MHAQDAEEEQELFTSLQTQQIMHYINYITNYAYAKGSKGVLRLFLWENPLKNTFVLCVEPFWGLGRTFFFFLAHNIIIDPLKMCLVIVMEYCSYHSKFHML